jgi:hypothetical protein
MTRSRSPSRRRSEVEPFAGLPRRRGGPAMSAVERRASLISGDATTEMSAEPTLNLRFRPRLCENLLQVVLRETTTHQIAPGSIFSTSSGVERPPKLRGDRVFTQPRPQAVAQIARFGATKRSFNDENHFAQQRCSTRVLWPAPGGRCTLLEEWATGSSCTQSPPRRRT